MKGILKQVIQGIEKCQRCCCGHLVFTCDNLGHHYRKCLRCDAHHGYNMKEVGICEKGRVYL